MTFPGSLALTLLTSGVLLLGAPSAGTSAELSRPAGLDGAVQDTIAAVRAAPLDTLDGLAYGRVARPRVTVWHAPGQERLAASVADFLEGLPPLPGLPDSVPVGVDAVPTHSAAAFDALTGGVVPEWRAGVAIPARGLMVVPTGEGRGVLDPEGRKTLRHEWAHLGLHQGLGGLRAPRWFNEGYAQLAAGEWDASRAWRLRLLIALGRAPALDSLTLSWPRRREAAESAYLLSASAVAYLLEASGPRGLEVLFGRWVREGSFETALRATFGVTSSQFEEDWKRHVRRRYGWVFVLSHSTVFWMALALVLLLMVRARRRWNLERMARLRAGEPPDDPAFWAAPGGAGTDGGPTDASHGVD